ncbi:MAG: phosphate transporter substrate-binding protein PhoT family [Eubacterium sp.]|nr:phosphate transporter substrate-binding protein PhoT family [Eubacterium sp.]
MKRTIINKVIIASATLLMLLAFTGCRDSSIEDDFDDAAQMASTSAAATTSKAEDVEVSKQLSIADSTSASLSEIKITEDLKGSISIDGSALMSAISDKIAEQFRKACPGMTIKTALSGTEEGITKFLNQQLDICNTSRQLSSSESNEAKAKGLAYTEFKVAYDGVVVVVNKDNPVDTISSNELKAIWEPGSSLITWKEVNPNWPENDLMVFGPKANTGLIEFFTKNILKTNDSQIGVYTEVNSDKELVKSIEGDNTAIGLTGFANYFNSKSSIKALKVDFGSGPVTPDIDSIKNGKYQHLSSPMYLYVSNAALQRTEVKAFIKYYMENASKIVTEAGYVPLADKDYAEQLSALN